MLTVVRDPIALPEQLAPALAGDPRAAQSIAAATRAVRAFCRWHVAPVVTETVTLDGLGGADLALPSLRVVEVLAVRALGGVTWPATAYRLAAGGLLALGGWRWDAGYGAVEIDIRHGYEREDVPDVVQIILTAAARDLASPTGAIREQAGSVSVAPTLVGTNAAGGVTLLDHERADLAPYRIVM